MNDDQGRGGPKGADGTLPGPGQGWDDVGGEPRPIHHVEPEEYGTAPAPDPYGPPRAGAAGPYVGGVGARIDGGAPRPQGLAPRPHDQLSASGTPKLENNDIMAIVLSCFFPGIGHVLLNQPAKGIVSFFGLILFTIVTCGIGALTWPVLVVDAYMVATARKKRPVGDWEFFPR